MIAALTARDASTGRLVVAATALTFGILLVRLRGGRRLAVSGAALVLAATAVVGLLRHQQVAHSPVAVMADRRAAVEVRGTIASDPHVVDGRFGETVMVRLAVRSVRTRGSAVTLRTPVLVLGDVAWRRLRLGATVRVDGRLGPAYDPEEAAVLTPRGPPHVERDPGLWW